MHLLLLIAFIVPYVARTMMWVGVNHSQAAVLQAKQRLDHLAKDLQRRDDPVSGTLAKVVEELGEIPACFGRKCQEWKVWQLLLGVDKGPTYWGLALALLLYNLCRGLLTLRVGPLREEEEHSSYSPALKDYWWLIWAHRVLLLLFCVAVASYAWHGWHWLTTPVMLPIGA
ncbi:MAG: hypothetical protein ACREQA_10990 [Candidatus Binatia bacterium]